ncbi:uncharacterized protein LOC144091550 [Stigmatopora argus]
MNSPILRKSLWAFALLAVFVQSVYGQGKSTVCCKVVSQNELTEKAVAFKVQGPRAPCQRAVIFFTKNDHYCAAIDAPWVQKKIAAIREANVAATLRTKSTPASEPGSPSSLSASSSSPVPPSSSPMPPSSSFSPRLLFLGGR